VLIIKEFKLIGNDYLLEKFLAFTIINGYSSELINLNIIVIKDTLDWKRQFNYQKFVHNFSLIRNSLLEV